MNKPILFIETPRAGKHNHRFIVPTDYIGGDGLLSHFADSARQKPEGINFLATGKNVSQTSGRTGWEQLILANVDVKYLSATQMTDINSFLKQRLIEVDRLVTTTIDWNKTTAMVIPREELNQWLQELEQRLGIAIPAMTIGTRPAIKQSQLTKTKSWWRIIMETGIGVSLVLGIIAIIPYFNSKPGTSPQTIMELQDAQKRIKRLVDAIGDKNADAVINEIKAIFHLPDINEKTFLDTWRSSILNEKIPEQENNWPVSMFLSNDIATGLWNKKATEELYIANGNGKLQPLVECRIAIRNLMGVTDDVYTPFFQMEDFGNAPNPFEKLSEKVYEWTDKKHPDAAKSKPTCNTKPGKPYNTFILWLDKCIESLPPKNYSPDEQSLMNIQDMGKKCRAVNFVTQPSQNVKTP